MENRTNAGYTIINAYKIGNAEFVLGYNENAPSPYVTWRCENDNNYYWGHYFEDRVQAEKDFLNRGLQEVESIENIHHKQKKREMER